MCPNLLSAIKNISDFKTNDLSNLIIISFSYSILNISQKYYTSPITAHKDIPTKHNRHLAQPR